MEICTCMCVHVDVHVGEGASRQAGKVHHRRPSGLAVQTQTRERGQWERAGRTHGTPPGRGWSTTHPHNPAPTHRVRHEHLHAGGGLQGWKVPVHGRGGGLVPQGPCTRNEGRVHGGRHGTTRTAASPTACASLGAHCTWGAMATKLHRDRGWGVGEACGVRQQLCKATAREPSTHRGGGGGSTRTHMLPHRTHIYVSLGAQAPGWCRESGARGGETVSEWPSTRGGGSLTPAALADRGASEWTA